MSLSVTKSKPNNYSKYWKYFTNKIIEYIVNNNNNIVFLLWGNNAKNIKKINYLLRKNLIITIG